MLSLATPALGLDGVTLRAAGSWADEAFRRRVRERRDVQQLQYERGIVPNPVAHHNAAPRFVTRTISFVTSKGLVQTWRRARRGADQTNRPQPLPNCRRRLQNFSRLRLASAARLLPASTWFLPISIPTTSAPKRAIGTAVVPSPQPSKARSGGVISRGSTTASPHCRMNAAISVKSPFCPTTL